MSKKLTLSDYRRILQAAKEQGCHAVEFEDGVVRVFLSEGEMKVPKFNPADLLEE